MSTRHGRKNWWLAIRDDAEAEMAAWSELTPEQQMVKGAVHSHPDVQHILSSTVRRVDGSHSWGLYSVYVSDSATTEANMALWLGMYTGKVYVCGCWWMDGRQVGMDRDEDGALSGSPVFPVHPTTLEFMPDVKSYDEQGVETLSEPPTQLSQINHVAGQKNRDFTVYQI